MWARAIAAVCLVGAMAGIVEAYQKAAVPPQGLWPPVQAMSAGSTEVTVSVKDFSIKDVSGAGSQLGTAIALYSKVLFGGAMGRSQGAMYGAQRAGGASSGAAEVASGGGVVLSELTVSAADPSLKLPTLETDESYTLHVTVSGSTATAAVSAATYSGVLRGLETFSQLTVQRLDSGEWVIPTCPVSITDAPDFRHRGMLLDTSRHFLPVPAIQRLIDALMYSKMNVFHWHITDSHSFPLEITKFPNVTFYGAFSAPEVYTVEDVRSLVTYATARGVRIIAEIDTPGHARAFGLAPELKEIVTCADVAGADWSKYCAEPPCGQLNPASSLMYEVLQAVLEEVVELFPDAYHHLGFDEVNDQCWLSDPSVQKYMAANNLTIVQLQQEFYVKERAIVNTAAPGSRRIYWEEAYKAQLDLDENSVIQFWNSRDFLNGVLDNTPSQVIVSWADTYYEDCGLGDIFGLKSWCSPFKTWRDMYETDPLAGITNTSQLARVLGGEAALWSELNDGASSDHKGWPRSAAYGARLWNHKGVVTWETAVLSLTRHTKRLQARGIEATPIADEYCTSVNPSACF